MWLIFRIKGVKADALTTGIATISPLWVKASLIAIVPSAFICYSLNKTRYIDIQAGDPVPPISPNLLLSMIGYSAFFTFLAVWYFQARSAKDDPF